MSWLHHIHMLSTLQLISKSSLSVDPYNTVPEVGGPSTPRKTSELIAPLKITYIQNVLGGKKLKAGSPRSPCHSPGHSPAVEPKHAAIGISTEKKVNSLDTIRTEVSNSLKGLPVKQYQVDQVLEDLRLKG